MAVPPSAAATPPDGTPPSSGPNPPMSPHQFRENIPLSEVPPAFSFSSFLSHAASSQPLVFGLITNGPGNKALDAVDLVQLALNEECRRLRRGTFYSVPRRQRADTGTPCDLIFIDEPWGVTSRDAWDQGNWRERLELCDSDEKILPNEDVIPVCCRIFKFEESPQLVASSAGTAPSASAATYLHKYASHSDPAIAASSSSRIFAFSRPFDSRARVLITYRNQHSAPNLYELDAIEHTDVSTNFATPGDLSETFIPHFQDDSVEVFGRKSKHPSPEEQAAMRENTPFPARSYVQSNRDVVLTLIKTWNDGADVEGVEMPEHIRMLDYDTVKKMWQDIDARIALLPEQIQIRKNLVEALDRRQPPEAWK